MNLRNFQSQRDQELVSFQKEYSELKTQYNTFLNQAVYEPNPEKQAELVKQILSINSGLAKHVRDFIQNSREKFDHSLITKLTQDIIRYQKDFEQIQNSSDQAETLRDVLYKEKNELNALHTQFNIWLWVLLGSICLLLVLIFRTSIKQMLKQQEILEPSIASSVFEPPDLQPPERLYTISPV